VIPPIPLEDPSWMGEVYVEEKKEARKRISMMALTTLSLTRGHYCCCCCCWSGWCMG
jgi:hypothetical protein